jgi:hypothetical protein
MKALRSVTVVIGCAALVLGAGQDGRPLPDKATFLKAARERLSTDEALQVDYTFKERRTEMRRNDAGTLVPKETKLFEVYPSPDPDLTYYRLVEVDGKRVEQCDLDSADQKQLTKIAQFRRKMRAESAEDRQRRLAEVAEEKAKDREIVTDVLDVLQFDLLRRERFAGRDAIVVGFAPKPDARPKSREARIVQHFKGLAWVDEETRQVVRAEADAIDSLSFGWGILARINQGLHGEFVRREVHDGVWLPVRAELYGSGRIFFFKKLEIGYVNEYFDYQKMDPENPPRFVARLDP